MAVGSDDLGLGGELSKLEAHEDASEASLVFPVNINEMTSTMEKMRRMTE